MKKLIADCRAGAWAGIWAMIGLLTVCASAQAADDPMSAYYGNTLACSAGRMQCHIWFKPDGSYRRFEMTVGADGATSVTGVEGRYQVSQKNGSQETCLAPRSRGGPPGARAAECYVLAGHKVGDAWDAKTAAGTSIHLSLQAGHRVNGGSDFLE